jgi:hypothetical protein
LFYTIFFRAIANFWALSDPSSNFNFTESKIPAKASFAFGWFKALVISFPNASACTDPSPKASLTKVLNSPASVPAVVLVSCNFDPQASYNALASDNEAWFYCITSCNCW